MFRKALYLIGIYLRNKQIFENYRFLVKSQYWKLSQLENNQFERLKELLHYAYQNSLYYHEKYKNAGFHPNDFKSMLDMGKIPFIEKKELLQNTSSIQVRDPKLGKLFYSETSGSTGKPLVFYRNYDWDAWHRASYFRGYSWYNVRPWEKNGYLWGYNTALRKRIKIKFLDILQNRFRLFSYKDQDFFKFGKKLKNATYLGGYSSMIYEIAKKINKLNMQSSLKLKMVKGTSEKIFDAYQKEASKAFGRKIISEYGAAEAGIIAFECPQGNMHVNMETVIVEEVNKEIVVTNLVSKSFPIIRYKLGDYINIDSEIKCKCGMRHYIIREVMGRIGKTIYGHNYEYPSLTLYYVFKNLAMENNMVLNYQCIQHNKGHVEINIEQSLTKSEKIALEKEFRKYFSYDVKLKINDNIYLKSDREKRTDFISYIKFEQ